MMTAGVIGKLKLCADNLDTMEVWIEIHDIISFD